MSTFFASTLRSVLRLLAVSTGFFLWVLPVISQPIAAGHGSVQDPSASPLDQIRSLIFEASKEMREDVAEADAMAKNYGQKAQEILNGLEVHPDERDFLQGQLYIVGGKADLAVPIFSRLLDADQQRHRVRTELASALARSGRIAEAKEEYETVLSADGIPPSVSSNIERALQKLAVKKTYGTRVTVGVNFDDNVNVGPPKSLLNSLAEQFGLALAEENVSAREDFGWQLRLETEQTLADLPVIGGRLVGSLSYFRNDYFSESEFDYDDISLSIGPEWSLTFFGKPSIISSRFIANKSFLGGEDFNTAIGGVGSMITRVSNKVLIGGNLAVQDITDETDFDNRSGSQVLGSLLARVEFGLGLESFERVALTPRLFLGGDDANKSGFSNQQLGLGLGLEADLPYAFSLYVEPLYRSLEYDGVRSDLQRESGVPEQSDEQWLVNLNLSKRLPWYNLDAILATTYTENNSNLPEFTYDRSQIALLLSKEF